MTRTHTPHAHALTSTHALTQVRPRDMVRKVEFSVELRRAYGSEAGFWQAEGKLLDYDEESGLLELVPDWEEVVADEVVDG